MGHPDDKLPDEVLVVLRDPDIELPGEREALRDVLNWMDNKIISALYVPEEAVLPCDQFVWSGGDGDT